MCKTIKCSKIVQINKLGKVNHISHCLVSPERNIVPKSFIKKETRTICLGKHIFFFFFTKR